MMKLANVDFPDPGIPVSHKIPDVFGLSAAQS